MTFTKIYRIFREVEFLVDTVPGTGFVRFPPTNDLLTTDQQPQSSSFSSEGQVKANTVAPTTKAGAVMATNQVGMKSPTESRARNSSTVAGLWGWMNSFVIQTPVTK